VADGQRMNGLVPCVQLQAAQLAKGMNAGGYHLLATKQHSAHAQQLLHVPASPQEPNCQPPSRNATIRKPASRHPAALPPPPGGSGPSPDAICNPAPLCTLCISRPVPLQRPYLLGTAACSCSAAAQAGLGAQQLQGRAAPPPAATGGWPAGRAAFRSLAGWPSSGPPCGQQAALPT
jgi:hypothetical protein